MVTLSSASGVQPAMMDLTFSQEIISSKIGILTKRRDYLLDKRDCLQTLIDETNEVIQVATSWMTDENGGNKFTFTNINKMAEDKLVHLCATELFVACEKQKLGSATPQHGSARHGQASVVPDDLQKIATEIKEMQDSISILRTDSDNISEKQSSMEKHIDSLSDNYLTTQQQRMTEVEERLEILSETQKETMEQQNKRIKSLEDELKHVADEQSDFVERYNQQQDKIKEQKEKSERQSKRFTSSLDKLLENIGELSIKFCLLENDNSLINAQLEGLENKVNYLEASFKEHLVKLEECGSSLEDFTKRSDDALKSLTSDSKSILENMQKFEDKTAALEVNLSEISLKNEELFNKFETEFKMLCIVAAERLAPLEKLRNIFNIRLAVRTQNIKRLNVVCDQMTLLLPNLNMNVPSSVLKQLRARSTPTFGTSTTTFGTAVPAFGTSSPTFGTAVPAFGTSTPVFGMAVPAFGTSTPAFGTSSPTFGISAPTFGTAVPAFGTSTPTFGTAVPAFGTSTPAFGTSSPTFGISAPTFGISAPTFGTAVPAFGTSTPTFGTAVPAFGTSTPVFGTAVPAFGTSTPAFGTSSPTFGISAPTFGISAPTFGLSAPTSETPASTSVSSRFRKTGARRGGRKQNIEKF